MNAIRIFCLGLPIVLLAVCGSSFGLDRDKPTAKESPKPATRAPVIRLSSDKESSIEVAGLLPEELKALAGLEQTAEKWQQLFAVYVERSGERTRQPAMLGSYRIVKDVLRFEPRFPLVRGIAYRAVLHPANLPGHSGAAEEAIEKVLLLPKAKPAAPTVVAQVYPSKNELPENQLKFYLHFSAPMSRGDAYEHIRLLRSDGRADEQAFLELPQELWDRDGKRFTLLIDPGRIKRGLKPREDLGPVLEAGKRYTLVIDRAWKDAEGNPLKETYRKTFRVLPPDETQPDPKTWKITSPAAGTSEPLVMISPKSLDHALLHRMVWITEQRGEKVSGTIEVTRQETCWRFTPATPWQAGRYHLVADTRLEDLAGNSIGRPFEVDELRPIEREHKVETVRVPFKVLAKKN
ncbi:MAG: Ig-like domain-containing domain [Gemmataceae bacterium]